MDKLLPKSVKPQNKRSRTSQAALNFKPSTHKQKYVYKISESMLYLAKISTSFFRDNHFEIDFKFSKFLKWNFCLRIGGGGGIKIVYLYFLKMKNNFRQKK